jgi:hypothetical protein
MYHSYSSRGSDLREYVGVGFGDYVVAYSVYGNTGMTWFAAESVRDRYGLGYSGSRINRS